MAIKFLYLHNEISLDEEGNFSCRRCGKQLEGPLSEEPCYEGQSPIPVIDEKALIIIVKKEGATLAFFDASDRLASLEYRFFGPSPDSDKTVLYRLRDLTKQFLLERLEDFPPKVEGLGFVTPPEEIVQTFKEAYEEGKIKLVPYKKEVSQ